VTIDAREQRTGERSGDDPPLMLQRWRIATGELAYDIQRRLPGNVVRTRKQKPLLRKRVLLVL